MPFCVQAQEVNFPVNNSGFVEYTEVVELDSFSADNLYSTAKIFIGQTAASAKDAIQVADDVSRTILVKGNMDVLVKDPLGVHKYGIAKMTITIACKDKKYKYTINDIRYQPMSQGRNSGAERPIEADKFYFGIASNKNTKMVKESIHGTILLYISSLKREMSKRVGEW